MWYFSSKKGNFQLKQLWREPKHTRAKMTKSCLCMYFWAHVKQEYLDPWYCYSESLVILMSTSLNTNTYSVLYIIILHFMIELKKQTAESSFSGNQFKKNSQNFLWDVFCKINLKNLDSSWKTDKFRYKVYEIWTRGVMNARRGKIYPKMGKTICTLKKWQILINNLSRGYCLKLHLFGVYVFPECVAYLKLSFLESDNLNRNRRIFRNSVAVKRCLQNHNFT